MKKKTLKKVFTTKDNVDIACAVVMQNNPDAKRIVILSKGNVPIKGKRIVRKGRWHYFKWGKRLIYIKEVKITEPEGSQTIEITRAHIDGLIEPKPLEPEKVKELITEPKTDTYISDVKLEWKVFNKKWND